MEINRLYTITKRIKLHTKPMRTVDILQHGMFVKETSTYYIFDSFRVKKNNVINIRKDDGFYCN